MLGTIPRKWREIFWKETFNIETVNEKTELWWIWKMSYKLINMYKLMNTLIIINNKQVGYSILIPYRKYKIYIIRKYLILKHEKQI